MSLVVSGFATAACAPCFESAGALDILAHGDKPGAESRWKPGLPGAAAAPGEAELNELRRILAVSETESGGLRFPCPFRDVGWSRVYWDRQVDLDLAGHDVLEMEISSDLPEAVRTVALYLRSGKGFYLWISPLDRPARHKLSFPVGKASVEGAPAGWDEIESVRIAFSRAADADAAVEIHSLLAKSRAVVIVEGSLSAVEPAERNAARGAARLLGAWLDEMGVPHALMRDEDVMAGRLRSARVAIMAYNPLPPGKQIAELSDFLERGGKLIVFYSSSDCLAELMGVRLGAYMVERRPGQWSSFAFDAGAPGHLPAVVFQESRNIRPVYPDAPDSRVIAYWRDADADIQPEPAWVRTDGGYWMSHILLDGDGENKKRMLLGLLGDCEPPVWIEAARHSVKNAGRIGDYDGFENAALDIARRGGESADVSKLLAVASRRFDAMLAVWSRGQYPETVGMASALRRALVEAYARAHGPAAGEFRGVWDHSGAGLYPGDWSRTFNVLSAGGINAVFPNVLWPGRAHYPSSVVPPSRTAAVYGDQLEQCVSAARDHGIQVHAWKVCWNLGYNAGEAWIESLEKQGRLQRNAAGSTLHWLCPSDPANIDLELRAISEVVRNYRVHGIHLDYIRYPNADACYCPGCRRRFEREIGHAAPGWPHSVTTGALAGRYRAWRADRITEFMRLAHETVRKIRPDVKISAAVYPGYPDCIESVGQDWGRWLEEGLVDFVCPMNYVPDVHSFSAMTERQLALPGSNTRVFPGIGATAAASRLSPDRVIDQVEAARRAGAGGFVLFELNRTIEREVLPFLRMGVTRD